MQELTLTGATLLQDHPNASAAAATSSAAAASSWSSTAWSMTPSVSSTNTYASSPHQHDHSHGHQHDGPGSSSSSTCSHHHNTQPPQMQVTLKIPPQELVQQQTPEQLFSTVQALVRMGPFALFESIVEAYVQHQYLQQQQSQEAPTKLISLEDKKAILQPWLGGSDEAGHSLLHWAAKRTDQIQFVQFLVTQVFTQPELVARPSSDDTRMTALHWACTLDQALPIIRILLYHGSSASSTAATVSKLILEAKDSTGCTPLLIAAQYGQVETVAYLIQQGANLGALDDSRDSATHWAAYKGSETVLGLLSYYDARPLTISDAFGQSPLHLAALRGHVSVCRYILQQLSLPQAKELLQRPDKNGRTPYQLAVHKNKPAVAAVLQQVADQWPTPGRSRWLQAVQRTARNLVSMHEWKVWLGLPEVDDVDESPRFPYYYVSANIVLHVAVLLTVFFPFLRTTQGLLWDCTGLMMTMLILTATTIYTFRHTTLTDPGRLNDQHPHIGYWRKMYEETLEAYAHAASDGTSPKPRWTLCHSCHVARPPRCKHDRFSRACILQFDHHCPFVGNTVGLYNYRWFLLFLVSMTLYLFTLWVALGYWMARSKGGTSVIITIVCFALGIHILFPLGMLIYHAQLVYGNLTTNEHIGASKYDYLWEDLGEGRRRFRNPYDKGLAGNILDRLFPSDASYLLPQQYAHLSRNSNPASQPMSSSESHRAWQERDGIV